jgi:ubiquitin C-terminal hydrolase
MMPRAKGYDSPMSRLFQYQLIEQLKCDKCGHLCHFFDLNVFMFLQMKSTLEASIKSYFNQFGQDWSCPNCKKESPYARKVVRIHEFPKYMALCFHREDGTAAVPVEMSLTIDFTSFSLFQTDTIEYHFLSAVVYVSGGLLGGHYYTVSRIPTTDQYVYCDGGKILSIEKGDALERLKRAYVVILTR